MSAPQDEAKATNGLIVALVNAYSRGDLIPADEVRELWEAAEGYTNADSERDVDRGTLKAAVEAIRERMER